MYSLIETYQLKLYVYNHFETFCHPISRNHCLRDRENTPTVFPPLDSKMHSFSQWRALRIFTSLATPSSLSPVPIRPVMWGWLMRRTRINMAALKLAVPWRRSIRGRWSVFVLITKFILRFRVLIFFQSILRRELGCFSSFFGGGGAATNTWPFSGLWDATTRYCYHYYYYY